MKKILAILVVLLLIGTTTALAKTATGLQTVNFGILEIEVESDSGATIQSNTDNQTVIVFDLFNMKPGDTQIFDWAVRYLGEKVGKIDYLQLKAIQDGGIDSAPETIVDPDNSGDLGSLLICTLNYNGKDYILPMDEVLSPEGMIYYPNLFLNPNESVVFRLTFYWPNHYNDNLGQGDKMTNYVNIHMTEIEPTVTHP